MQVHKRASDQCTRSKLRSAGHQGNLKLGAFAPLLWLPGPVALPKLRHKPARRTCSAARLRLYASGIRGLFHRNASMIPARSSPLANRSWLRPIRVECALIPLSSRARSSL